MAGSSHNQDMLKTRAKAAVRYPILHVAQAENDRSSDTTICQAFMTTQDCTKLVANDILSGPAEHELATFASSKAEKVQDSSTRLTSVICLLRRSELPIFMMA